MANDLNKVTLIGRIGKDAEIDTTQSGTQVMKFNLATNTTNKSGEDTEWHMIRVYNEKLIDKLHMYLTKGKQVYVEGKLTTWKKDENNTIPFITLSYNGNIQLLGSKNDIPEEVKEVTKQVDEVFNGSGEPTPF